ncbi:uncharacterized protein M421DRAFT_274359 [Didymella exigua CBS 183.55]|uniref:Uncharacterized protein n=1 Tax=Didymella exigua CBS 183.55 TaxID=1150837 RepID=A0A6A5RBX2_9PLEO|nr:uncharacterized protein M421DRAFT_274359 [Didymella exigua CBS 183.55]KAF1924688.1 hypothetical protein M421DRAFT_274359 [Didymella exigua CBS 183.55]
MRKKVTTAAMADAGDSKSIVPSRSGSNVQSQDSEFIRSVKRLGRTARSTAQALHASIYLQRSPSVIAELIPEIYTLGAILSSLEGDLLLVSALKAADQEHMWASEHHNSLTRSIKECDDILMATFRAVIGADEQSRMSTSSKRTDDYIDDVQLDDGPQVSDTIVRCSHLVHKTKVVVRHTALSRVESLNEEEIQELFRLTRSLQHPDFDAIWALKNEPFASKHMQLFTIPSFIPSATPVGLPEDAQAKTSNTPDPSPKSKNPIPKEDILPIWAYNQWPPFGNYQHPAYLAATARGQYKDNNSHPGEGHSRLVYGSTLRTTTASTRSIKPFTSSDSDSKVKTGKTKPGEASFGEPSVIKPPPDSSLLANISSSSAYTTYSQPQANPSTPTPRLEAYILRPTVQTTEFTSTLSYGDEPLRLSEEHMQARIRSLESNYSIMDVLLDLHPQQLHLMQCRAAQRHGHIVSVQHGKTVSLETVMGSLQVKPTVYVVSTTTVLPQKSTDISYSTVVTEKSATSSATSGSTYICGDLFQPKIAPAGPPLEKGLFQNLTPASVPGPGTTNSYLLPGSGPTGYLSSPVAYSRHLQERGETCTYVGDTERKGAYQHYQTITANKEWNGKDQSLEEIRLVDYNAGRTGRGLFAGLNQNTGRSAPPPTEANALKSEWLPEPPSIDDVTYFKSGDDGFFPKSQSPPSKFPGFSVDNSGQAPVFSKLSAWAASLPEKTHARPSSGTDLLKGLAMVSTGASSNPFGHFGSNMQPFVPPQATQPIVSASDATAMRQPLFGNIGPPIATEKPPVSSGFGEFAGASLESPFAAFANKHPAIQHPFGLIASSGSDN